MSSFTIPPAEVDGGRSGCLKILVPLLILSCLLFAVGAVLVARQQAAVRESGIFLIDADPDLTLVERLVLQSDLVRNRAALQRAAGKSGAVSFEIAPGASASQISAELAAVGLLEDPDLFLSYLRYYGLDSNLQSGQFTLNGALSIPQLADVITRGITRDVTLHFLRGMRLEEMAAYLTVTEPAQIDPAEFLALAQNPQQLDRQAYPFLNSLPAGMSLEGFLFPGTYELPFDADARYLIELMLRNFDQQVTPAMRQAYGAQGLSLLEAVTLASIVERETPVDDERRLIASVYTNRVKQDMPLQADPTVQYAAGYQPESQNWWKVPLSLADLEMAHPYNTYRIPGLPPGPIANPGLTSLQAIAEPQQTDFLFFVLDCESNPPGRHVFSRTYEEHLANVQRCR